MSNQAVRPYEGQMSAGPFGILRPRIFPRERLICFRYRVEMGEHPFLCQVLHSKLREHSRHPRSLWGIVLYAYLLPISPNRQEGICSAQPLGAWMRIRRLELGALSLWGSGGYLTHPQYGRCFQHTWALSQLTIKHSQVGTVRLIFIYTPTRTGVALP